MTIKYLSVICTFFFSLRLYAQADDALFRIIVNGKMGYIDSNGVQKIKPAYWYADEFSEGLAAVREDGLYGYINTEGIYIIKPDFDYAMPFRTGRALVYKNGRPFFIDKTGNRAFDLDFKEATDFESGRAYIATHSGKQGVINIEEKLVADTVYSAIYPFIDGLAVVEGLAHNPYPYQKMPVKFEVGIIDTNGKFIVPYGKYKQILIQSEGYFTAVMADPARIEYSDGSDYKYVLLDKSSKEMFAIDGKTGVNTDSRVHNGLLMVQVVDTTGGKYRYSSNTHIGFVNLSGKLVIDDANYKRAQDFSCNRAFVTGDDGISSMIDTKGKVIARNAYERVHDGGFRDNMALVQVNQKWGIIDTNGKFILQPTFEDVDEAGIVDGYLFFRQYVDVDSNSRSMLTGIAKTDGTAVLPPVMERFDSRGFRNGILRCVVGDKLTYVNKKGEMIWQENKLPAALKRLNIDYMNRACYTASSLYEDEKYSRGYGGWAGSANIPVKMVKQDKFQTKTLSIVVDTTLRDTFAKEFYGVKCYVVNDTKEAIEFNASDSKLSMLLQAMDAQGHWKDIEYVPSSWCGNSYHTVFLPPQHYWNFAIPQYDGAIGTRLRVRLDYIEPGAAGNRKTAEKTVYSNEFAGKINPGQFWRKEEYNPAGIMDPYRN